MKDQGYNLQVQGIIPYFAVPTYTYKEAQLSSNWTPSYSKLPLYTNLPFMSNLTAIKY